MPKCLECKVKMQRRIGGYRVPWGNSQTVVQDAEFWECEKCGERVFSSDEVRRLQEIAYRRCE